MAKYNQSKLQQSPANIGRNRELFCKEFLSKVLPPKLRIGEGEIWDSKNNRSGQLDIIIIREDAPSLNISEANIFLTEGVFGIIDVKSVLSRAKLQEAITSLNKVKNLTVLGSAFISRGSTINRPLRCVFAYESAKLSALIDELLNNENREVVDIISVLDQGVIISKNLKITKWSGEELYLPISGRAAALGFLYFYLVQYSTAFLSTSLRIAPYFEPLNGWRDK
ncbi:MAG: DUF6602 domain-containing protein [Candidatus Hermodarchaeota archaeon]